MPEPVQYGHGWQSVRSRACLVRLRVMAIRPNSLKRSIFEGARSARNASSSAAITFSRLRRSSMSMKSMMMIPPRSRRRICRTISFTASTLVRTIVSSRRFEPLLTNLPVFTPMATSASVWLMTMYPPDFSHTFDRRPLSISCWMPESPRRSAFPCRKASRG